MADAVSEKRNSQSLVGLTMKPMDDVAKAGGSGLPDKGKPPIDDATGNGYACEWVQAKPGTGILIRVVENANVSFLMDGYFCKYATKNEVGPERATD
jgi:hypothetical protein